MPLTATVIKEIELLDENLELTKIPVGEEIIVSPAPLRDGTYVIYWNKYKVFVKKEHFEIKK